MAAITATIEQGHEDLDGAIVGSCNAEQLSQAMSVVPS
jgi:hypothetical protein